VILSSVQQQTRARLPRRPDPIARAGSLWVPKERRIECFGGGSCGGFGSRNAASAPRDTPLNIDGNANLKCWFDPSARLTLHTTLLALTTGSPAPSVCTISADTPGTLSTSIDLLITVANTGTRDGGATFNYSINGGATNYNAAPIAMGADVVLPGIGLRVQFALGTYTAGVHSYRGVLDQVVEGSAAGHVFTSPVATTSRVYVKSNAKNGRPTINSDASGNKYLKCSTSLAATLGAGSRTFVGIVKTNVTAPGSTFAWLALNSSTDPDPYWKIAVNSVGGANDIGVFSTSDAGVNATTRHGQALDLLYHLLTVVWDAGTNTVTAYDNGVQIFTGSQAVGTQTFDTLYLLSDVGPHALNGEIGEFCLYDAALPTATRQTVEGYFRTPWGFT
jgi:hypothetical protein